MRGFIAGVVLALAVASAALAEDERNVNIVNETGYGIKFLGFNNPGDDDWSDNELGSVRNGGWSGRQVQHRRRRLRVELQDRMGGPRLSRRAVEGRRSVQDQHAEAALQPVERSDLLPRGVNAGFAPARLTVDRITLA
jgi:hypothetical protein